MQITNKEYMKNLFRLIIGIAMIAAIASCGKGNSPEAKKAELEKLKTQYTELGEKIKTLEAELAGSGDSTVVVGKSKEVIVTTLALQPFYHSIDIQGRVEGDENVTLSPKMAGSVIKVNVSAGSNVKAGQVLAEIEHDAMDAQLADLKNSYQLVKDLYEKQKSLWDQKVGTEVQYLQAKNNKESLELKIRQLTETIQMYKMVAPYSGTVDEVTLKVGQIAAPGMQAIRVVNLNKLKVKANLAESYAASIHSGDKVNLIFPDINKSTESHVVYAGKVIDPMTRTFNVEVALPAGDVYRPNMVAQVGIIDYNVKAARVVPVNVIQEIDGKNYVYVAIESGKNKVAHKQEVKVGVIYNGKAEILDGLNEGDNVITTGYNNLNEGTLISF